MRHVPRFVYDTDLELVLTWPAQPYTPIHGSVGGARWSAVGVGASHVVRYDHDLLLTLRVEEGELAAVVEMIEWAQALEAFDWYPDADDEDTSIRVFLAHPEAGEEWSPRRDAAFPSVWLVDLTLRQVAGLPFDPPYFSA